MTKNIFQAMSILFLGAAAAIAAPARWIHVRVESARGTSENVTMNVPIQMAQVLLPAITSGQHDHSKLNFQASVNGMDVRAMLDAVHDSPDNVSVNLERHDKEINVAKSGQDLLIKISDKPGVERKISETVAIKVPIPVVRALLADNSNELNIAAGIRALVQQGDVDVTVNKEKETVRVWTDANNTSD